MASVIWVVGADLDGAHAARWSGIIYPDPAVKVFGGAGRELEAWVRDHEEMDDLVVLGVIDPEIVDDPSGPWLSTATRAVGRLQRLFAGQATEAAVGSSKLEFWWWCGPFAPDDRTLWITSGDKLRERSTPELGIVAIERVVGHRVVAPQVTGQILADAIGALAVGQGSDGTQGVPSASGLIMVALNIGITGPFSLSVETQDSELRLNRLRLFHAALRKLAERLDEDQRATVVDDPAPRPGIIESPELLAIRTSEIGEVVQKSWQSRRVIAQQLEPLVRGVMAECIKRFKTPLTALPLRTWRERELALSHAWLEGLERWCQNAYQAGKLGGIHEKLDILAETRPNHAVDDAAPARATNDDLQRWEAEIVSTNEARFSQFDAVRTGLAAEHADYRRRLHQFGFASAGVAIVLGLTLFRVRRFVAWIMSSGMGWKGLIAFAALVSTGLGAFIAYLLYQHRVTRLERQLALSERTLFDALVRGTRDALNVFLDARTNWFKSSLAAETARIERAGIRALQRQYQMGLSRFRDAVDVEAPLTADDPPRVPDEVRTRMERDVWPQLATLAWNTKDVSADKTLRTEIQSIRIQFLRDEIGQRGAMDLVADDEELKCLSSVPGPDVAAAWIAHSPSDDIRNLRGNLIALTSDKMPGRFVRCQLAGSQVQQSSTSTDHTDEAR